jgi:hypothetical protein
MISSETKKKKSWRSEAREIPVNPEDVVMMPWLEAVRALGDRELRFRVLRPPYAVAGLGTLRALRVVAMTGEHDGAWELTAGYDGYDKL